VQQRQCRQQLAAAVKLGEARLCASIAIDELTPMSCKDICSRHKALMLQNHIPRFAKPDFTKLRNSRHICVQGVFCMQGIAGQSEIILWEFAEPWLLRSTRGYSWFGKSPLLSVFVRVKYHATAVRRECVCRQSCRPILCNVKFCTYYGNYNRTFLSRCNSRVGGKPDNAGPENAGPFTIFINMDRVVSHLID